MWREHRRRSRSPRGSGLNTRRISSALCALGRYKKNQPEGLEVDDGTFELENLMEVWGKAQGLTKEDILDAVNTHMFQDSSTKALRYSVMEKDSKVYIRVFPSKGGGYRGRKGYRFDRESARSSRWGGRENWRFGGENEVTDNEDDMPYAGVTKEEPETSAWPLLTAKTEEGGWTGGWAKTEEAEHNPRRRPFVWTKQES